MRAAVVKLGGSTADHKAMDVWTAALAVARLPLVVVPGGGAFADQVRDEQRRLGFSDAAAHAMAILAMDQFGHVILDRHERFSAARSPEEIDQALADGKIPVWLPSAMAVPAPEIPASWGITSDSLAAWLAGKLGAEALLLVKQSKAFANEDSVADLMARRIVSGKSSFSLYMRSTSFAALETKTSQCSSPWMSSKLSVKKWPEPVKTHAQRGVWRFSSMFRPGGVLAAP